MEEMLNLLSNTLDINSVVIMFTCWNYILIPFLLNPPVESTICLLIRLLRHDQIVGVLYQIIPYQIRNSQWRDFQPRISGGISFILKVSSLQCVGCLKEHRDTHGQTAMMI